MKQFALLNTKHLFLYLFVCCSYFTADAQYQWQPVSGLKLGNINFPNDLSYETWRMYIDPADTSLWIMGNFTHSNNYYCPGFAVLNQDGTQRFVPWPHTPSNRSGLGSGGAACRYNGKMYVGGDGLYAWDGSAWTVIDTLSSIECLYPYQGKLLVGGSIQDSANSREVDHILMEWDGVAMRPFKGIDSITKSQAVYAITEYQGELIIAGNIIPRVPRSTGSRSDIMRWTGTEWKSLGNGLGGNNGLADVSQMAVIGNDLFVGGQFDEAHGNVGNNIARWDGATWHRMGAGVNNSVFGISAVNDTLYVAGGFEEADAHTAYGFAAWHKNKWCANNTPISYPGATSCSIYWNGQIVVGGSFLTIGRDSCSRIAILKQTGNCNQQTDVGIEEIGNINELDISVSPNPTYSSATVNYYVPQGGEVAVTVTDPMGRRMASRNVIAKVGKNSFTFNLKDYAEGIYFLNLSTTQKHEAVRIIKY